MTSSNFPLWLAAIIVAAVALSHPRSEPTAQSVTSCSARGIPQQHVGLGEWSCSSPVAR